MTFREATSEEQSPPERMESAVVLNPATSVLVQELAAIRSLLSEIHANAERREIPAPTMFRIPTETHVRIRSTQIVIFPDTVGVYSLRVGTENRVTFAAPDNGVMVIPLEATFERGIRISIVDSTGAEAAATDIRDAFIFGYPE